MSSARNAFTFCIGEARRMSGCYPQHSKERTALLALAANIEFTKKSEFEALEAIATEDPPVPQAVLDAASDALCEALDCTLVWDAWSYGTMSEDDFVDVAKDSERVKEIAVVALRAVRPEPDTRFIAVDS